MKPIDTTLTSTARARIALLALLLVLLSATVFRRLGEVADRGGNTRRLTTIEYSRRDMPRLLNVSNAVEMTTDHDRLLGRDPFIFGVLPVEVSPKSRTVATEEAVKKPNGPKVLADRAPKPTGPRFDWEYLGYLGPKYLRVAAFRKNGDVEVAILGQVVNSVFVLRRIGPNSVDLELLSEPAAHLMTIELSED